MRVRRFARAGSSPPDQTFVKVQCASLSREPDSTP